jgi:hypothetical protein
MVATHTWSMPLVTASSQMRTGKWLSGCGARPKATERGRFPVTGDERG